MSSPSFLVRLRTRSRRSDPRPGQPTSVTWPDDHWHAGDPRILTGSLALASDGVPVPRRPVDLRRGLSVVPEVDVRGTVVDLRPEAPGGAGAGDGGSAGGARPRTAPMPVVPAAEPRTWSESSTWLG